MSQRYHSTNPETILYDTGDIPIIREFPDMDEKAYYGLAGEFVKALNPNTEADPAGILIQTLVAFGAACGRNPHFIVEGSRHGTNEFAVLVGDSSKARKGTSEARVRDTFSVADLEFSDHHIKSGLASGEGLIWHVRDPIMAFDPKKNGEVLTDPGIEDKRLLIFEPEFANVLKMVERDGNSLSATLRVAWDGRKLSPLTKSNRIEATDPHISLIGHITIEELQRRLTETESANGFGNRILWVFVRRSKLLPLGGNFTASAHYGALFKRKLETAKTFNSMKVSQDFEGAWKDAYSTLSTPEPGLAGLLTSRSEAHALRLSMIYALLDGEDTIRHKHLVPALAIIDFVQDAVRLIFGQKLGDPVQDKIIDFLEQRGEMSLTDIGDAFGWNLRKERIGNAIETLMRAGRVTVRSEETGGRPKQIVMLIGTGKTGKVGE